MRIVVFGAGGVGGYFGARLAASGANVTFIARGKHLEAMRSDGLRVHSPLGNLHIKPVKATDDPQVAASADLVLLCVKLWDTEEAVRALAKSLGPNTAVVSFQNGVDAIDTLTQRVGIDRVIGGLARIFAVIDRPGVIVHSGTIQKLTFGELNGRSSTRTANFLSACLTAGIDAELSPDILRSIWEKFVFIVGLSAMTSVTRLPIGPIRKDPYTRKLLLDIMHEAAAIGRARGVLLDTDAAERQLTYMDSLPDNMVASMTGDLNRGHRLELPWLSGAVVRMGKELGIATPANHFIYSALKLHADGRPPG